MCMILLARIRIVCGNIVFGSLSASCSFPRYTIVSMTSCCTPAEQSQGSIQPDKPFTQARYLDASSGSFSTGAAFKSFMLIRVFSRAMAKSACDWWASLECRVFLVISPLVVVLCGGVRLYAGGG